MASVLTIRICISCGERDGHFCIHWMDIHVASRIAISALIENKPAGCEFTILQRDAQVDDPKLERLRKIFLMRKFMRSPFVETESLRLLYINYIWTCCNLGRATFGGYQLNYFFRIIMVRMIIGCRFFQVRKSWLYLQ